MATREQTVELVSTKQIEMFIPILRGIDFGDQFLLSMLHWCGIGRRSTPLEYWEVFLIRGCWCFRALQTTRNAFKYLLARIVLNSVAEALAAPQSVHSPPMREQLGTMNFGVIRLPGTTSLGVFTVLKSSDRLTSGCVAELLKIQTSS
jgi:hypothetical protein